MNLAEAAGRLREMYFSGSTPEQMIALARHFAARVLERLFPLVNRSALLIDSCMELLCKPNGKQRSFQEAFTEVADKMPEEYKAWVELETFWPIALAFLSVDKNTRSAARALREAAKKLCPHHIVDEELSLLLDVLDDEPIVVVSPENKSGFIGKMSGLVKNEQLHVLLMNLFLNEEEKADSGLTARAVSVAKGMGPQQSNDEVYLEWNMYRWRALAEDHTLPEPEDMSDKGLWIWDIDTPRDIPKLYNHRVVLLGAPSYARHWQARRHFELLRAELSVIALSHSEIDHWLTKITDEPKGTLT